MEKYIGKSVYKGTAIGPVSVLKKKDSLVKRIHIDNTEEELKRLDAAKERTMTQLGQLYEKALQEVGEVNAAIFEVSGGAVVRILKLNDLVDFSFHLFYILYRKGIVVVLKNEIPYSKCLNGVLRFFFYIILAILHLERGH